MENTLKRSQIHEYQKYCVDFIKSHPVSALFLDCGLGKTIISLTAIYDLMFDELKVSKVLVIAPLRVTNVWKAEVQKWEHLTEIDVAIVVGTVKQRTAAINSNALIYAVNRENVKWLVEYYEKNGLRWDFDMIVIDELSSFKNYQSQRFKWLRKVRPFVKRWVGLTGTPTSNGLMDLRHRMEQSTQALPSDTSTVCGVHEARTLCQGNRCRSHQAASRRQRIVLGAKQLAEPLSPTPQHQNPKRGSHP